MLIIEKKTKNGIGISLKRQGKLITPTFAWAFGIAFALHFSALIIFQVSPFKFRLSQTIFPPVQVKVDFYPSIEGGVLAELENEAPSRLAFPSPPKQIPEIREFRQKPTIRSIALPTVTELELCPFEMIHFNSYTTEDCIHLDAPPNEGPSLSIWLTGGIADHEFILEGTNLESLIQSFARDRNMKSRRVMYRIQVENKTGKIFWYHQIGEGEKKRVLQSSETILKGIRFDPIPGGFITEGSIEIDWVFGNEERNYD